MGDDVQAAEGLIDPLRQLTMPIYAVYGNHDYWSNNRIVRTMLEETPNLAQRIGPACHWLVASRGGRRLERTTRFERSVARCAGQQHDTLARP